MSDSSDLKFFDDTLQYLQQSRSFDFTAYKRGSLMRRVVKRMHTVAVPTFEEYLDYLQVHPDEFNALFNTILINVTSFFRDPEVWKLLETDVLPEIVRNLPPGEQIRVWSAGCASGAEPYSVAILLAELLGGPDGLRDRVKIYATDVDEEALAEARQAVYEERQMADIPPHLVDKYFDRIGAHHTVNRELRRAVIFGRHDLLQDAPISKVDLLLCRNTIMYFNSDAQARILARFYFSLKPGGLVVLGRAEMLFSHGQMFTPVDLKRRLFRAVPKPANRDRLLLLAQTGRDVMITQPSTYARLKEAAFDTDTVPQIVLDQGGTIAALNAPARHRFGLTSRDTGRPFQDLEVSYRPFELRDGLQRAVDERRDVVLKDVQTAVGGTVQYFDIVMAPLADEDRNIIGTRISFQDVTQYKSLEIELQHSKQELETAYEELQSTNEELETTNEELQSTVEELETTNEELQSTNEELETMNEELQSTNEELQTMNDELRTRSSDLNSANAFLESVFTSLRSAVVVIDREFHVQVWNGRAEDLWGMRPDEAQQGHFLGLDIGLPVADLSQPIREVMTGVKDQLEVVVPAISRRGRSIECRVNIAPLRQMDRTISGAILLMDESQNGERDGQN